MKVICGQFLYVKRAKHVKLIKDAGKARNKRLEEKKILLVEMRPEFA